MLNLLNYLIYRGSVNKLPYVGKQQVNIYLCNFVYTYIFNIFQMPKYKEIERKAVSKQTVCTTGICMLAVCLCILIKANYELMSHSQRKMKEITNKFLQNDLWPLPITCGHCRHRRILGVIQGLVFTSWQCFQTAKIPICF